MKTFFAALLTFFVATNVAAQSLTVAAASDLQPVLPEIAKRFEKEMKIPVRTTFGSSGNFFAQIENGAPFDLFLSADVEYPGRLEDDGFAVRGSRIEYAVGRIVLWTRKDSDVNVSMSGVMGVRASICTAATTTGTDPVTCWRPTKTTPNANMTRKATRASATPKTKSGVRMFGLPAANGLLCPIDAIFYAFSCGGVEATQCEPSQFSPGSD